jgi:hypothetical protein
MGTFGIILGILMGINLVFNIAAHNWAATCGWVVAILEWTRRFTVQ